MSIQVVDRLLDVIDVISNGGPTTVAELARKLELSRPTAYRLVKALELRGYVRRATQSGQISLGMKLIELGQVARADFDFARLAVPVMRGLVDTWRETCHLLIREDDHAVIIERVESPQSVRVSYPPYRRIKLFQGASSQCILAFLESREQKAMLERWSQDTELTDIYPGTTVLQEVLQRIQSVGYNVTQGEVFPEVAAVAVPVRTPDGDPAAMSLNIPASRFRMERVPELAASLRKSAEILESQYSQQSPDHSGSNGMSEKSETRKVAHK